MASIDPQNLGQKRAYIAGPVSGRVEEAKVEFAAVAADLEARGYIVINPLAHNDPLTEAEAIKYGAAAVGRPYWCAVMRKCICDLLTCDEIWMLPGWTQSTGARTEAFIAITVGMLIYDAPTGTQVFPSLALTRSDQHGVPL